jgi:hypothetical protein
LLGLRELALDRVAGFTGTARKGWRKLISQVLRTEGKGLVHVELKP